jgi:hypothetical protein
MKGMKNEFEGVKLAHYFPPDANRGIRALNFRDPAELHVN